MTNFSKGTDLENAVKAIEKLILQDIEQNKVQHIDMFTKYKKIPGYEIDLFIHIKGAFEYDSIFIFECKNWDKEKVGRKEITDFAEKIDKSNAQKGFFIAKSFTADAIRRIEEDSRIKQVIASNVINLPMLFWDAKILDEVNSKILKVKFNKTTISGNEIKKIKINGKEVTPIDLIGEIIDPKYVSLKFGKKVKEIFNNNLVEINGLIISKMINLRVDIKYLNLESRIDMSRVFGIEDRGSHLTISHFYGDEHIFDTDITCVKFGDKLHYTNTVYNAQKPLKGLSLKMIDI